MKTIHFSAAAALALTGLLMSEMAAAQISLVHSPYRQDFNSIGTGLPAGWSVRAGAAAALLGTAAAFTGTPFAWTSSTGGFKNFAAADGLTAAAASAEQLASSNRALGLRSTGTLGDPGGAWVMNISRTEGLTHFMLNFKLQSLDASATGRTMTWRVDYGFGASPVSFEAVNTNPAVLATTHSATGWGSTLVTVDFAAALDNRPDLVWIRIAALTPSSGAGSRPSVAIDDVELSYSEPDMAPPVFLSGYPGIAAVSESGFELRTNLDETSHVYFVVLPEGSPAPASDRVRRGEDALGELLPAGFSGSVFSEIPSHEYMSLVGGLSAATAYEVYVVAEDLALNLQLMPVKLSCRTGPKKNEGGTGRSFSENFDQCGMVNSFTTYSVSGAQGWSCTKSGLASGGIRMNGYAGRAYINEDWLISPLVRLEQDPWLTFYSQVSFNGIPLHLKLSVDYAGSGNPALASWTDLPGSFPVIPVSSTSTDLADWKLSTVDLTAYAAKAVYVAWVYTSTSVTAARWTLDSIRFIHATASFVRASVPELSFKSPGIVKSCTITGFNLVDDLTITAPESYEVSGNAQEFSERLVFNASSAAMPVVVYVRLRPRLPVRDHTGYIRISSAGVALKSILVRGADVIQTFDITTYNLGFFGTDLRNVNGTEFGPANDALQIQNVRRVMEEIGSDIFALQEISDDNALNDLVAGLPGYAKIVSGRWSHSDDPPDPNFPPQKIGFVFDTTTIKLTGSRVMFSKLYDDIRSGEVVLPDYPGSSTGFWSSGRLPFMAEFKVTLLGVSKSVKVIVIHAKSGSLQNDYDRREYDLMVLHDTLMMHHARENIVLVGDFNDEPWDSIKEGAPSSFHSIVKDTANFKTLTSLLDKDETVSYLGTDSMLDHVVISDEMVDSYIGNSLFIEDARNYISNYAGTTSDHLPVTARFGLLWQEDSHGVYTGYENQFSTGIRIYPIPVIDQLEVRGIRGEAVSFELYDALGKSRQISFEREGLNFLAPTDDLAPGWYILRVIDGSVEYRTRFVKRE